MKLNTCSAVISFVTNLEEQTAKFYEKLAQKYPEGKETFLPFFKDNQKNKTMIERVYYGVISDALEACFCFEEGLDPEAYKVEAEISEDASYSEVLKVAVEMEELIRKAYTDAAALSEGLMADVPRAFRIIARKRSDRVAKLEALMEK